MVKLSSGNNKIVAPAPEQGSTDERIHTLSFRRDRNMPSNIGNAALNDSLRPEEIIHTPVSNQVAPAKPFKAISDSGIRTDSQATDTHALYWNGELDVTMNTNGSIVQQHKAD